MFQNPPPPVYMQFYFFNLTNPAEVLDGDTPVVLQIGPYTYRSVMTLKTCARLVFLLMCDGREGDSHDCVFAVAFSLHKLAQVSLDDTSDILCS